MANEDEIFLPPGGQGEKPKGEVIPTIEGRPAPSHVEVWFGHYVPYFVGVLLFSIFIVAIIFSDPGARAIIYDIGKLLIGAIFGYGAKTVKDKLEN